jgi:hypothetical protein
VLEKYSDFGPEDEDYASPKSWYLPINPQDVTTQNNNAMHVYVDVHGPAFLSNVKRFNKWTNFQEVLSDTSWPEVTEPVDLPAY